MKIYKFNEFNHLILEQIEDVILYHGSDVEFDEFDDTKISSGDGSELFGKGFYLTNNEEVAKFYGLLAAKKHKITGYNQSGIFGSTLAEYSKDADEYAQNNHKVNTFKVHGNILNAKTFIIDEQFKNFIIESYAKYSGFDKESAERSFNYLKQNKQKINKFRGELEYIIKQVAFADEKIKEDIIDYIKKLGYDGVKYESDKSFEGEGSWNYVIYNKKAIKPLI